MAARLRIFETNVPDEKSKGGWVLPYCAVVICHAEWYDLWVYPTTFQLISGVDGLNNVFCPGMNKNCLLHHWSGHIRNTRMKNSEIVRRSNISKVPTKIIETMRHWDTYSSRYTLHKRIDVICLYNLHYEGKSIGIWKIVFILIRCCILSFRARANDEYNNTIVIIIYIILCYRRIGVIRWR